MDKVDGIRPIQPAHPTLKTKLDLKQESEKRRQQQDSKRDSFASSKHEEETPQESFAMVLRKTLRKGK